MLLNICKEKNSTEVFVIDLKHNPSPLPLLFKTGKAVYSAGAKGKRLLLFERRITYRGEMFETKSGKMRSFCDLTVV